MSLTDELWSRVSEALASHGLRRTPARRAIAEAALTIEGYFDTDELFIRARQSGTPVSRATTYRLVPILCKLGLLHETDFGDGHHRYCRRDAGAVPMAEVYVADCGKILQVPAPFLTWYAEAITAKAGFILTGHRLQTFARCTHQAEPGACAKCTNGHIPVAPPILPSLVPPIAPHSPS